MRKQFAALLAVASVVALLLCAQSVLTEPAQDRAEAALKAAMDKEMIEGDLRGAIEQFKKVAQSKDRPVAARALIRLAECYQKLGDAQAKTTYERLVREFGDQKEEVAIARARLARDTAAAAPAATTTQRVPIGKDSGSWSRVSPDGRYLSFIMWDSDNLAIRELGTDRVRPVTSDGIPAGKPGEQYPGDSVFSPDSRQIAYEWCFEENFHCVLRVVATAENSTATRRTLYENAEVQSISPTDWSADGRWISVLIGRKDRTAQIGLVNFADGTLRVLKTVDWAGVGGLRFSPDSSVLAYHRSKKEGGFERDIFVIAVDGTREVTAAATPGEDMVLEWTPGGDRLLFASDRGGSMARWSVPVEGGAPGSRFELVKPDVGEISSLGLTRSGVLYYHLEIGGANIYVAQFDTASGQLSSAPIQPVQQFRGLNTLADWSGDGKSLAYVSRRGARPVLAILSMETGSVRELYPALSYMAPPSWSPDNRQFIARGADLKGRSGIVKIDATTGEASLVVPNEVCSGGSYWAPGSTSFFCYDFTEKRIAQVDVQSGAVLRTFQTEGQGSGVSPDGRYIVYGDATKRSLRLLTLATSETRELIAFSPPSSDIFRWGMDWTPDSRSVVFYGRQKGEEGMWLVPLDGSAPRKIKLDLQKVGTWRFNRKTGQVAFGPDLLPRFEVWKMEHFLPVTSAKR